MDGGCTFGDFLDDANSNCLGDIGWETPMSTTRVVYPKCGAIPGHTKLLIVMYRSVSTQVLSSAGTLVLGCVNGFKLINLIYAC